MTKVVLDPHMWAAACVCGPKHAYVGQSMCMQAHSFECS